MGGSVKAPAPDPALQEANIESLRSQADIGRRTLALQQELTPIQKEQMQFGLDAARTGYEQTQADRAYALEKRGLYDKAVDAVLSDSEKFDEATRRQELMQMAQADISQQFSSAQDQQRRGLARAGVAPGSGKALMAGQQAELAEAAAKSRAGLLVTEAAKKEGLQLKGQNVAMLSGYPMQAASLTPTGANLGVMGLDVANTGAGGMMEGLTAAGKAAADYGASAGNQWANANKLYIDANAHNSSSKAEMTGSLAGAAITGGFKGWNNYKYNGNVFDTSRVPKAAGA